jgi:diguanylate cyclase (GGDEF)-like protein
VPVGVWRRLKSFLPQGRRLPDRDWQPRHRVIIVVLAAHAIGIFGYRLWSGQEPVHCALEAAPVALAALLAASPSLPRRLRACVATTGAMGSSAILVQLSGGLIETHFHFFVMLAVITLYQDWVPFLLAAGFVVVEHAVVGVVAPRAVYSHSDAWHHPVRYAMIHALFITGAGIAAVANWRLTENAQAAERATAERLVYEAGRDALTGALNHREFDRRLAVALSRPRGGETHDALCFLDLDRFKIVNDSRGHAAGDALLRQVTDLIRGLLHAGDELARVGGDEFAVLLVDCDLAAAADFAERVRAAVAERPFTTSGRAFSIGVSIGVVALTEATGGNGGRDALRAADAACYAAKDKGRNRVHVVARDDGELSRQQGEVHWAERLMRAFQDDSLMLYYQPIASIGSADAERFGELLLRMRGEDGGVIAPGAFLPAAERYNLVGAVDRWVVHAAFAALAGRHPPRGTAWEELFSINLSGGSIGDESFLDFVRAQLAEHQIPPRIICFEITETVAITDVAAAIGFITELRALGCRFALDDFGSGLSSFTYLKQLPVDFVKIDGTFVREITTDAVDRAMVESVNRISHEMGLRTVAEFVENDAIMQCLRQLGVDFAQGYGVGRPEPFDRWLLRNPPAPARHRELVPPLHARA